jgi:hypothetical protein
VQFKRSVYVFKTANWTIVHLVEFSLDLVYSPPVVTVFPQNITSYARKLNLAAPVFVGRPAHSGRLLYRKSGVA